MKISASRQKTIEDIADFYGYSKLEIGTLDKIARTPGIVENDLPAIQRAVLGKRDCDLWYTSSWCEDNQGITLTDKGKHIAEQIDLRLVTRKAVKDGLDMFPAFANIRELNLA